MYLSDKEKQLLSVMESNLSHHNAAHPGQQLTINQYIASGNRIDVILNGQLLAGMLTFPEANYFIFGVTAYADKTKEKRK